MHPILAVVTYLSFAIAVALCVIWGVFRVLVGENRLFRFRWILVAFAVAVAVMLLGNIVPTT